MLYHFVTGQLPFSGETALELLIKKEQGQFKPARRANPEVPERLDLTLNKMLAKIPEQRYAGCDELIRDIETLNIEDPVLSFIESSEGRASSSSGVRRSAATLPASKSKPTVPMAQSAVAQKTKAARQTDKAQWYIRFQDANGKIIVSRMTTAQIRQAVQSEMLDLKTKAKRTTDGEFLPLAQYTEFDSVMQKHVVKARADKRSTSLKDVYAQIDKADRRRKRWRWLTRKFEGILGGFGLLLWLVIIASAGYGLYLDVPWLYDLATKKFNLN